MKKFTLLFIGILSMSILNAQDITDAVRYSLDEIQGTARYKAMAGAFGALGGDMSAVSINPAGSAIFNNSHSSVSFASQHVNNDIRYFDGVSSSSDSEFDINQGGGVFVFNNYDDTSPWKKFVLGFAYDQVANYDNNWVAAGTNTTSIDSYFLANAQGLRLDEISAFPGESFTQAYAEIGFTYGFNNQQAFLGFESYVLEPENNTDDNTVYTSNIAPGSFNQRYDFASTGYNGKFSFNLSTQYKDNFYFGLNLNTHFINYRSSSFLRETNSNVGSLVNLVDFGNTLFTTGTGFSFQLGTIIKVTNEFRIGATYNSPTWFTISDETTQFIATERSVGNTTITQVVDPRIVNIFQDYNLNTPGKLTGSLAYIFGDRGLISFDYSVKDFGNTKLKPSSDPFLSSQNTLIRNSLTTASTYKFGGEYRYKQISFRGGYRLEESPYKDEDFYGDLTGYSFGLGYNFGNLKLDLAVDLSDRTINQQLYNVGLTDAATIDSNNTNIIMSLAFNL